MLKKIGITIAVLLVVGAVLAYMNQQVIMTAMMRSQIGPEYAFSVEKAPQAPDYSNTIHWAAWPGVSNPSNDRPEGLPEAIDSGVAVFFVHPTSYMQKENWNQPLGDEDANWVVDNRILRHQASVFNGCCEIYAPRYRQATFFSFMVQEEEGKQPLDLAYSDVAKAFDYFLTQLEDNQPFIVAGHSQGTFHSARLVREKIAGKELQQRLVAAYLIGFSVEHSQLGGLPTCQSATETGCAVGWNATDGDNPGLFPDVENLLCTNPLTWKEDQLHAGNNLNKGGIGYPSYGPPAAGEDVTKMEIEVGAADAQCVNNGTLIVTNLQSLAFPSRMFGGSMHVYDYSLYHMNIRENVAQRIAAYQSK